MAFVAAHRFVLADQVERFTRAEPDLVGERLVWLEDRRLVRRERLGPRQPALIRVTPAGLRTIASRLPAPGPEAACRHEVGVVSLWLSAWEELFGAPDRVLSVREMRALDRAAQEAGGGDGGFAVPVPVPAGGAAGGAAGGRLYPDVMLVFGWGRCAVHLVIWPYRRLDPDGLFAGHRARPQAADIVFALVDDIEAGEQLRQTAERYGVSEKLRCQKVVLRGTALPAGQSAG